MATMHSCATGSHTVPVPRGSFEARINLDDAQRQRVSECTREASWVGQFIDQRRSLDDAVMRIV